MKFIEIINYEHRFSRKKFFSDDYYLVSILLYSIQFYSIQFNSIVVELESVPVNEFQQNDYTCMLYLYDLTFYSHNAETTQSQHPILVS